MKIIDSQKIPRTEIVKLLTKNLLMKLNCRLKFVKPTKNFSAQI